MASLTRPAGYKPRITQIQLGPQTLPQIAKDLASGQLVLQAFEIVRVGGDKTPISIDESELLAPNDALYEKLQRVAAVAGNFWVREDRTS